MKKYLAVLGFVALLSPVSALADEVCMSEPVSHEEYKYQEQIDIDPRGGFYSWQNVGAPTEWTADTEVNGHAADEKFDVGRIIKVTHRWHVVATRTVVDVEASEVPCETEGGSSEEPKVEAPAAPTSGGGGPCHPSTGFPECQQNVAYFAWKAHVDLWQQLLSVLNQYLWELEKQTK